MEPMYAATAWLDESNRLLLHSSKPRYLPGSWMHAYTLYKRLQEVEDHNRELEHQVEELERRLSATGISEGVYQNIISLLLYTYSYRPLLVQNIQRSTALLPRPNQWSCQIYVEVDARTDAAMNGRSKAATSASMPCLGRRHNRSN